MSIQAIRALPYLATVLLLAGFVGRAITPKRSASPTSRSGSS
jgi:simple sugar transport system permease protein